MIKEFYSYDLMIISKSFSNIHFDYNDGDINKQEQNGQREEIRFKNNSMDV
jgi:hypothetical protein